MGCATRAALFGWARAIAVREAVRVARRAAREQPAELTGLPAPGDPMLAADIRDVLSRLAPEHRAVLMLRDLEGLDERTAAALLRVPVGTVKSRLARAGPAAKAPRWWASSINSRAFSTGSAATQHSGPSDHTAWSS